ncbi:MAG: hypothetical protein ACPGYL_00525, partial [Rhodospirillaceae bacterium]
TFRRQVNGVKGISPQVRVYESIAVHYRPVWNPASSLVFAYQAQPYRTTDYGIFSGQWTLNGGYLDPLGIQVDKKIIEDAIRHLRPLKDDRNAQAVAVIPLHYKSFTGQSRNEMFSLISNLLNQTRQDLIAFELVGLLDSLPVNRLPQLTAALTRLSRFVAVRTVPDHFDHIKGYLRGVRLLGIDLSDISRHGADPHSRSRVMAEFSKFSKEQGIASFVWDLRTIDEVKQALALGYSNMNGLPIAGEQMEPRNLYQLSAGRIVR